MRRRAWRPRGDTVGQDSQPQFVTGVPNGARTIHPDDEVPTPTSTPPSPAAQQDPPNRVWLHVLLFAATFVSAMFTQTPWPPVQGFSQLGQAIAAEPERLLLGLPFAITLMTILLAHEMGHYVTARILGVRQSLPFFIPAPFVAFGTLGAVIIMRSQPKSRTVLLRVAAMGPYAGLILAIPAAAWGLAHSVALHGPVPEGALMFGDSLLFKGLEHLFSPNGTDVILHPVAMAAWVGLFITSLNLIPAAQLDGGHICYALLGKYHLRVGRVVACVLLFMGAYGVAFSNGSQMWLLWAVLLFALGLKHPPVAQPELPMSLGDTACGVFAFVVFVLTFTPTPLKFAPAQPVPVLDLSGRPYDADPRFDNAYPYDDGGGEDGDGYGYGDDECEPDEEAPRWVAPPAPPLHEGKRGRGEEFSL